MLEFRVESTITAKAGEIENKEAHNMYSVALTPNAEEKGRLMVTSLST